jgi:2-dehydropantoate 2-reductase
MIGAKCSMPPGAVCRRRGPILARLRLTIVGAGAVGGSLGACLARAGHDVQLVDRVAEHVDAINIHGLQIEGTHAWTVAVPAFLPEQVSVPLGTVVLAVKTTDTADAIASIAARLGADECVVSLQNGLEEPKIADGHWW